MRWGAVGFMLGVCFFSLFTFHHATYTQSHSGHNNTSNNLSRLSIARDSLLTLFFYLGGGPSVHTIEPFSIVRNTHDIESITGVIL